MDVTELRNGHANTYTTDNVAIFEFTKSVVLSRKELQAMKRSFLAKYEQNVYRDKNTEKNEIIYLGVVTVAYVNTAEYRIARAGWQEGGYLRTADQSMLYDSKFFRKKDSVILGAIAGGHYRLVKKLIIMTKNIHSWTNGYQTLAATIGDLRVLVFLRQFNLDIQKCFVNASAAGRLPVMALMLRWGKMEGAESLLMAASSGRMNSLRLLKRWAAKLHWGDDIMNDIGSAFARATGKNHMRTAEFLIKWLWEIQSKMEP